MRRKFYGRKEKGSEKKGCEKTCKENDEEEVASNFVGNT
jgi:hypothetical protein